MGHPSKTAANRLLFAERRLCGCGMTFLVQQIAVCLQSDVHAAANRCLFAGRLLRGCETTFMRQQIGVCLSGNTAQQAFLLQVRYEIPASASRNGPAPTISAEPARLGRGKGPRAPIRHRPASLCPMIQIVHEAAGLPHPQFHPIASSQQPSSWLKRPPNCLRRDWRASDSAQPKENRWSSSRGRLSLAPLAFARGLRFCTKGRRISANPSTPLR